MYDLFIYKGYGIKLDRKSQVFLGLAEWDDHFPNIFHIELYNGVPLETQSEIKSQEKFQK